MSSSSPGGSSRGGSSARRAVLGRLMQSGRATPAGRWGHDEGAAASARPQDRRERAQGERLYRGVLRRLSLLDALLQRPGLYDPRRTPAVAQWILRMAAYERIFQTQTPDYAIGQEAVNLARHSGGAKAAGFMNAMIRRLLPQLPRDEQEMIEDEFYQSLPPEIRLSVPRAILREFELAYGPQAGGAVAGALAGREAAVWLRLNSLKGAPDELCEVLQEEGIELDSQAPLPYARRWTGQGSLPWETAGWSRGLATVQDVGAMLATALLDPKPGARAADLCAAPGGKTGHMWECMQGSGELLAVEVAPERRGPLRENLTRLYGHGHPIQISEVTGLEQLPQEPLWDFVMVDAPCQALGLLGRHPEVRWDGRLQKRSQVISLQQSILDEAARRTAPGGRLLWVTCSPTRAENEDLLEAWLAQNPAWEAQNPTARLAALQVPWVQVDGATIRTRPDLLDCDGFAMTLLERHSMS